MPEIKDKNSINKMRRALMPDLSKTAGELAQETGFSIVTVNTLLKQMLQTGEAQRGESVSSGGRPGAVYTYNKKYRVAAIAYGYVKDGRLQISVKVISLAGDTLYSTRSELSEVTQTSFDALLDSAFVLYKNIAVIAFGLPGVEKDGVILVNDFRALEGEAFLQRIHEKYGTKTVFINDVNGAAKGYYTRCANGCASVTAIWMPKAFLPGLGLVLDGKIYNGYANFAGEISCLPIGIDWHALNYENADAAEAAAARLVSAICCIAAPEKTVIYGDFWRAQSASNIMHAVQRMLLGNAFSTETLDAASFEKDFELGLAHEALDSITWGN